MTCPLPVSQRTKRTLCPCGGFNTIRVVVEYIAFGEGRVDYAGGRYCYHHDALIDIEIPDGATPVQALIYDLHDPDEIIRITFMQSRHRRRVSPDPGEGIPGEAGDDE